MKVKSGVLGSRSRAGLLRICALVALALGVTLVLLLAPGSVRADGPYDFLVPIVLEEGRTPPPDLVEPPSTPVPPDVQTMVPIAPEGTRDGPKLLQQQVKPELVVAEIYGAELVLTFDQILDTTSGTAPGAFTVKIDGGPAQAASAISIGGRQVTLTVPEVSEDQSVTVSYTKPASNPLKSSDGQEVASFTDRAVKLRIDRLSQPPRDPIYVSEGGEKVENEAKSAERDTLLGFFEDECDRTGRGDEFDSDQSCAFHKLYERQSGCDSEDWRDRNPHLLDSLCPTYRTW